MIRPTKFHVVLLLLTLVGCNDRPVVGTEKAPFAVAGVTLGTDKDEVRALGRLGTCSQESERVVSCSYTPEKERVLFLGQHVTQITYQFTDDSPKVGRIRVSTVGAQISELSVRWDWKLEERCVDDYVADTIRKFSWAGRNAIDDLKEMGLRTYTEFACLSADNLYVSGSSYSSSSNQKQYRSSIEMFVANSYAADAMNKALSIHSEIEARSKALNAKPGS